MNLIIELADYKDKDRIKVAKEIAKVDNVDFITSEIKKPYRRCKAKVFSVLYRFIRNSS